MGLFRRKEKKEQRDWLADSWTMPTRAPYFSVAGPYVDLSSTLGLATAGAAVKLISQSIGMMPLKVYQGEKPDVEEARDSWQWERLKKNPNDDQSAFDFWQDTAGSIETNGNAYIWKAISRRPVRDAGDIQLILIDPSMIMIKRDLDTGKLYYEVRRGGGKTDRVPASQILHVRGWSSKAGSDYGLSTIAQYRETLGSALAAREYQARFFSEGTSLPGFVAIGEARQEDVDRTQKTIDQKWGGLANAHRPGVLANDAKWVPTGISMQDAQYIQIQGFAGEEICRIFGIWPRMLGFQLTTGETTDDDIQRFLQVDLGPRIRRIEMALAHDADLFPASGNLFPEFLTASVLKPAFKVRSEAYAKLIEAGIMEPNEIRALENLPPHPDGSGLQKTPVGGAPNTPPKPAPA